MSIFLEVEGELYGNFTSASVTRRLDALSGTFNFQIVSKFGNPLPIKVGDDVNVIVNNETILTGTVEVLAVSYNANQHIINITGRDLTGDLIDSSLDSLGDTLPTTLKEIIELVLDQLNIGISVIDQANTEPFNQAEDVVAPEPAQNAFDFIEQYARKRQVLLTTNGDSDILITRSTGTEINSPLRNILNGSSNNIKSADVTYDTTGRFNIYKFASALNPIALNNTSDTSISNIVDQKGQVVDDEVAVGRQLVLISENPFSDSENDLRAEWEKNIKKSKGIVYNATLQGFLNDLNETWKVNNIISIVDDFAGINSRMLINSVTFSFDLNNGSQTRLGLVDPDSYNLAFTKPQSEEIGFGLT